MRTISWESPGISITISVTENETFPLAKEKANVIFDANGGTAQETERNVPYGSVYGKLPEAQREGYILTGWYTKPDGGSKISETDIMSEKAGITLYAHWEAEQYTVTLDSMGGNCEISYSFIENLNFFISLYICLV